MKQANEMEKNRQSQSNSLSKCISWGMLQCLSLDLSIFVTNAFTEFRWWPAQQIQAIPVSDYPGKGMVAMHV